MDPTLLAGPSHKGCSNVETNATSADCDILMVICISGLLYIIVFKRHYERFGPPGAPKSGVSLR